jgi:hypothetical protein
MILNKVRQVMQAIAAFHKGLISGGKVRPSLRPHLYSVPPVTVAIKAQAVKEGEVMSQSSHEQQFSYPVPLDMRPNGSVLFGEFVVPLEVEPDSGLVEPEPAAVELPIPLNRAALVEALLDEAWFQGLTTYPQLMLYVKTHSEKSCSKRAIANWKRKRGLLGEPCQAA